MEGGGGGGRVRAAGGRFGHCIGSAAALGPLLRWFRAQAEWWGGVYHSVPSWLRSKTCFVYKMLNNPFATCPYAWLKRTSMVVLTVLKSIPSQGLFGKNGVTCANGTRKKSCDFSSRQVLKTTAHGWVKRLYAW